MNRAKKAFCVIFAFVFFCQPLLAVKDDPIMIKGIRPMGMGGAFTAIADDENAVFYNPAGISQRTGWMLQIFNINTAVSRDAISVANDLNNVSNNLTSSGGDGAKTDDLIKIRDSISGKDIDFMFSVFNPAYISAPKPVGQNGDTISFGAGIFNSASAGVMASMKISNFMLDFMQLATSGGMSFTDQNSYLDAIPDSMLNGTGILQPGKTAADVRAAIAAGENWGQISANYLSPDVSSLIDQIQAIADDPNAGDGDKYARIVDALQNFVNLDKNNRAAWSLENAHVKATVNSYATATLDVPFAYQFNSLEALHLPGKLSLGVNLKYIQRAKFSQTVSIYKDQIKQLLNGDDIEYVIDTKAGASSGQGFGLDFGMMYSYTPRWNFGLQISDVFTNIDYNRGYSLNKDIAPDSDFTHTAYIAAQFNIGASYIPETIFGWDTKNKLTLAADIRDIFGAYENTLQNMLHIGAEYRYGCLALRAGLNKLRPAVGLGLEFDAFQLSYAYYGDESYLARALGDSGKTVYYHEFLLAVKIGHNKGRKIPEAKNTQNEEKNNNGEKQGENNNG
ncbi:MAG: hypothetical protein FWC57_02895 [Endomicrobia bacterium]|nr:hypothetical protein [Endomicrobiia bacterium]